MVSADVTTGKLCTANEQSGRGVRPAMGQSYILHVARRQKSGNSKASIYRLA